MKKIKINYLFFFVIPILYFLGLLKEYIIMFGVLIFHEMGHLLMLYLRKINISLIKIEPFGISIILKKKIIKNNVDEILIALAGPLMSFILFFILYAVNPENKYPIYGTLAVFIFNLIPAYPLDGGRILKACLQKDYGYLKSYKLALFISKITAVVTSLFGLYLFFITKSNFSVMIIGFFLLFNLLTEKNHTYFYLMKEISEYKSKNSSLEKIPISHIAVKKDFRIRKILSDLSFNRYFIFDIIENGIIKKTYTEEQLIDSLIKLGAKTNISDIE